MTQIRKLSQALATKQTHMKRMEIAFFGFARINFNNDIPNDVMKICLDYYPFIEVIFDVYSKGCSENISDDGLTVTDPVSEDGEYHTYMSSEGWNEGIHCFTLQPSKGSLLSYIGVGVMSSEEIEPCKESKDLYFLWTKNTECIAYCMDDARIFQTQNGSYTKMVNCKRFGRGDPLTMVLDCDKWTIQYFSNIEAITDALDIIADKTYHAVFSGFPSTLTQMTLTPTPHEIFQ